MATAYTYFIISILNIEIAKLSKKTIYKDVFARK